MLPGARRPRASARGRTLSNQEKTVMFLAKLLSGGCAALALCATAASAQTPSIQAEQAWARPTVAGQMAGGGYVTLRNTGPSADCLVGGSTPAAKRLELHEMKLAGDVMQMEEVRAVELP